MAQGSFDRFDSTGSTVHVDLFIAVPTVRPNSGSHGSPH